MRAGLQRTELRASSTFSSLSFPRPLSERHKPLGYFSNFWEFLYRLAQSLRNWSGDLNSFSELLREELPGERYGCSATEKAEACDCNPEACCGETPARQRVQGSLGTCEGGWAETPFRRRHLRRKGSVGPSGEGHHGSLATVSGPKPLPTIGRDFHSRPTASWPFKGDSNFLSKIMFVRGV